MKKKQKKYDTSQDTFYKVCETGWNLCSRYLQDFTQLKPYYTPAYINDALEAVKKTERLQTSANTLYNIKEIRTNMVNAARQVQHNWQILKLYITNAYPASLAEVYLKVAGLSFYKKSSKNNWSSLRQLVQLAENLMRDKFDTLTAKQNMPPAFPAKFTAAANKFDKIGKVFFNAKLKKQAITSHKIKNNNIAYEQLIRMLKDAQQIFRYRPEIKKQFVFTNLVSVYEKKNTAKNHLTASGKQPLQQAKILLEITTSTEAESARRKNVA